MSGFDVAFAIAAVLACLSMAYWTSWIEKLENYLKNRGKYDLDKRIKRAYSKAKGNPERLKELLFKETGVTLGTYDLEVKSRKEITIFIRDLRSDSQKWFRWEHCWTNYYS